MKFLKNIATAAFAGLAIVGAMTVAQVESASAVSLNFKPTGVSLDADPARDIATTVGATLNFDIFLNTFGLADDESISEVDYAFAWDKNELGNVNFNPFGEITSLDAGDLAFLGYPEGLYRNITQTFGAAVGADLNKKIATISFTVLGGLNNDGSPDFATLFFTPAELGGVQGQQLQFAEVQPVPTPALIPGIAAMGMGLLRRKKAQKAAA
jgi:hypothetical protein